VSGAGYDVAVVGSGFGGSVTALRLAEKGYSVVVLEAGRRFGPQDYPRTSWDVRNFVWAPRLGCKGIQRIHVLPDVVVLAGAGVGGGSLNYANTLYEPLDDFYADPQWAGLADWRTELAPYYDQAKRMLGAVVNPAVTPSDEVMRTVAEQMGVGDTFRLTPVGVYFGEPGVTVADPFFGGAGPARTGCRQVGECMTGCRHGAKNTLTTNYLHLAEQLGVRVAAETTVTAVRPLNGGGYAVDTRRTSVAGGVRRTFAVDHVVVAAGTYGTMQLLIRMRDEGVLPRLSPRLGELVRTNSEALVGATARDPGHDFTRGVAITSSFHPDEHTHIEPVRYGRGSNLMGLLATVRPRGERPTVGGWVRELVTRPARVARGVDVRRWSERTVIVLAMQSLDNSLTLRRRPRWLGGGLTSRQGHGEPSPTFIPAADETARRLAEIVDGEPGLSWGQLVDAPMTAHFLGGAPMGRSADDGVIDVFHRVHGHPGLHVVDGSAVSANLGVNPSLTITALAERAMAWWPNRGEPDPRPPLSADASAEGTGPVAPLRPAVPPGAPGALRLPPA
jgi:cholesterol oxidase